MATPAINPDHIAFAFDLPPDEAITYLTKKGYKISWDWKEMKDAAHRTAFTVAKVTSMDVLMDIRGMLHQALTNGTPLEQFKKDLTPKLKTKGWWGKKETINPATGQAEMVQLGAPWRLNLLYRQNLQSSYMAGRMRQQIAVKKQRPFWRILAVGDSRTRPSHLQVNGMVVPADSATWRRRYPPNGFGCRCRVVSVSAAQVEREGWKIVTASDPLWKEFMPDDGFNTAPIDALAPDLKKYPDDLLSAYKKAISTGPAPAIDPAHVDPPVPHPVVPEPELAMPGTDQQITPAPSADAIQVEMKKLVKAGKLTPLYKLKQLAKFKGAAGINAAQQLEQLKQQAVANLAGTSSAGITSPGSTPASSLNVVAPADPPSSAQVSIEPQPSAEKIQAEMKKLVKAGQLPPLYKLKQQAKFKGPTGSNAAGILAKLEQQAIANITGGSGPLPSVGTASGVPYTGIVQNEPAIVFPEDIGALEVVRSLGGSTGAQLVRDSATGQQFVMKRGKNSEHIRSEALADSLYQAMGYNVPPHKLYETEQGPVKLSQFIEARPLSAITKAKERAAVHAELQRGFAADALLGNWDVIGLSSDNVLIDSSGKVWRIDNGGSLSYRAQGAKKTESQWGSTVNELSTLRNSSLNPSAAKVFSGITDEEVRKQVEHLNAIQIQFLGLASPDVRAVLEARLKNMVAQTSKDSTMLPRTGSTYTEEDLKLALKIEDFKHAIMKQRYEHVMKEYITVEEEAAINLYTGGFYIGFASCLAGIIQYNSAFYRGNPTPKQKALLRIMNSAIKRMPKHDATEKPVLRNLSLSDDRLKTFLSQHAVGTHVRYPTVTSSSTDGKFASSANVQLIIYTGNGAWVDDISRNKGENEVLLSSDDSYEVVEYTQVGSKHLLTLRHLPED